MEAEVACPGPSAGNPAIGRRPHISICIAQNYGYTMWKEGVYKEMAMPVVVDWRLEGRVIRIRFSGDVTLAEIEHSAAEELNYLSQGSAMLVHSLIDISQQERVTCGIEELQNVLAPVFRHPAKGWTIVYGHPQDRLSNMVNTAVAQSYQIRHRIVGTEEEAFTFLEHVDPSLKNLS